jgi:hypothetical protein
MLTVSWRMQAEEMAAAATRDSGTSARPQQRPQQHASAYVSMRQHASACVGIRQHTCPQSLQPASERLLNLVENINELKRLSDRHLGGWGGGGESRCGGRATQDFLQRQGPPQTFISGPAQDTSRSHTLVA